MGQRIRAVVGEKLQNPQIALGFSIRRVRRNHCFILGNSSLRLALGNQLVRLLNRTCA
jgi:hypothetical protein